jgi:hypothetical protein
MTEFSALLNTLVIGPAVRLASLDAAPTEQGFYALWHGGPPEKCLKVGIAGPRSGKGIRDRLALHYASNVKASVLAVHMAADVSSPWALGKNFGVRSERQRFLADHCYFRVAAAPGLDRAALLALERDLVSALRPHYAGRTASKRAG